MIDFYYDGRFMKSTPKLMEAFTPGVLRGKGVFETMLGLDGLVLDQAAHIKRLHLGLKKLKIKLPQLPPALFKELLGRSRLSCARVRLMVWQEGSKQRVMAVALPYKIPAKKSFKVCLVKTYRPPGSSYANVKSLDYAVFAKAYTHAIAKGFDEALLLNNRGNIFEASRANIFWTKAGVLYTPPLSCGCLNGITRRQVISFARKLKIPFKEKNLTPQELGQAEGAFLTNSLMGLQPIIIPKVPSRK